GSLSLALDRGRIRDAPMRAGRVARPDRADLAGGIIANGDHMIEDRCLIAQKLVPRLGAKARFVDTVPGEQRQRHRMDGALWKAARRPGAEPPASIAVQDRFREDRARGIARAEEQDVAWPPG